MHLRYKCAIFWIVIFCLQGKFCSLGWCCYTDLATLLAYYKACIDCITKAFLIWVTVCTSVPVNYPVFVQVIHCRQYLAGVSAHLPLLKPLTFTDAVHQIPSTAQLHGHIVAVLCLQRLQQQDDVRVADQLMNPRFTFHVLQNVRILSSLLLIYHLDRHLTDRDQNREQVCFI